MNDGVTQCIPPSHILEDGRFIYLPAPTAAERSGFFERSIARHGLLEADMQKQDIQHIVDEEQKEKEQKDRTAPKIHPLAIASARIQTNGINELNRAINLATLVNTGEYFSYTNIVDPTLEADSSTAATTPTKSGTTTTVVSNSYLVSSTQKTEALFCLKRKLIQFDKATKVFNRHEKRLRAGIQAQSVIDQRLFQLRQQWRLVAPEHGTRARLHAARTNEVIAIDIDVYDRDRVHGSNNLPLGQDNAKKKGISLAGRLASRVPRYATIELQDTFQVKGINGFNEGNKNEGSSDRDDQLLDTKKQGLDDDTEMVDVQNESPTVGTMMDLTNEDLTKWTRAEPFAVADPSLGRIIKNFDPTKIPMLNLQLEIQKSSTGFLQSACLEPMSTVIKTAFESDRATDSSKSKSLDEELLVSLQHSLYCANLFESIRSELDHDAKTAGGKSNVSSFSPLRPKTLQNIAWLASDSNEIFLAPPSFLVNEDARKGLSALSVVHCHEGEVKVQLDSEYQLSLKLVEANADDNVMFTSINDMVKQQQPNRTGFTKDRSGSQSSAQLHALCRALLLHAQEVYHRHSLYLREREKKKQEEESVQGDGPRGLARIKKEDTPEEPQILQSCVSMGSKILFEQRIRKSLVRISNWTKSKLGKEMDIEWLPISVFNIYSKFTICCGQSVFDGVICRDKLTVTRMTEARAHRKVDFYTDREFEIYLKLEMQRRF